MALLEDIKALIEQKGAMGVNALSKELNIPLSTVQVFMTKKQTYFRKTPDRKWDLPERVAQSDLTGMQSDLANILESQVKGAQSTFNLLNQQMSSILTLVANSANIMNLPVANQTSREIPERLNLILDTLENLPKIIKKRKEFVSEEVYNLLMSTDWLNLMLDNGKKVVDSVINPELQDVLLGEKSEFSEDVLSILLEYQD